MILDDIVAHKRRELAEAKARISLNALRDSAERTPAAADYRTALSGDPAAGDVRLVAEIKRASPSKGVLCADLDVATTAQRFAAGGAHAISVLTDEAFFRGTLDDLAVVAKTSHLPVLRKDFIIDAYQIYEAALAGASAALLIVGILDDFELRDLIGLQRRLDLEPQVEVHNEAETERALLAGARIIGINNRDLRDFSVDLATTERLRPMIPADRIVISESGIHRPEDVQRLREAGVQAIHIGEALMTCPDPADMIRTLLGPIGAMRAGCRR